MAAKAQSNRARSITLLLAGLVLGQVLLYGASLFGMKILLPLDLLAQPATYLPATPQFAGIEPKNLALSDKVTLFEPARRFAERELHAGRLPVWAPYQFGGVPFIWPKFSPFLLLECGTASPVILAWGQLFQALVAGLGAYFFCRRVLGVSFWPATLVAWCYPLSAFFVLWQGYPTCMPVAWLPWILLAVNETGRAGHRLAPLGLAVVTALVLVSGHLDVAGQVLLVAGLFGVFAVIDQFRMLWRRAPARRAVLNLAVGFGLGFLLAMPYVLPVLSYTRTGARMTRRTAGQVERPPVGLAALPEIILPHINGSSQTGSIRLDGQTEAETSVAGYAGLIAALLAAPLAAASRRHRSMSLFLVFLAFFGLSWSLGVPGFVALLKLPPLNLMSHNRLVFVTAFAILALAAVGLEKLAAGEVVLKRWWWAPAGLAGLLYFWCAYRSFYLPNVLSTELGQRLNDGERFGWLHDLAGLQRVQDWFTLHYAVAAGLCAVVLAGWAVLRWRPSWQSRWLVPLGILMVADLLWFSWDRIVQCEPRLYYPLQPALEQVAEGAPGRVIGWRCLPASLASMAGLSDVRGYDGVDPRRMVQLLTSTSDGWFSGYAYAQTQWLAPRMGITSQGDIQLPPLLDLLGVRYVIFRRPPPAPARPWAHTGDYWVMLNPSALSRAFVPLHTEVVSNRTVLLDRLCAPDFNPSELAFIQTPLSLPGACRGSATLVTETPARLTFSLKMATAGLVVLADNWAPGWRAYLNGKPVPVLRVDHSLRGVVAPPGQSRLEFRYRPPALYWGEGLAGVGCGGLAVTFFALLRSPDRR